MKKIKEFINPNLQSVYHSPQIGSRLFLSWTSVTVGWKCLVCVLISGSSENARKLSSVIKLPHTGRLWE